MTDKRRVLIEEWLPAAAIGVECIRERSTGQQPPDKRVSTLAGAAATGRLQGRVRLTAWRVKLPRRPQAHDGEREGKSAGSPL